MIALSDIEQLANLARLELHESEKGKLLKDLESILGYISELTAATVGGESVSLGQALVTNVTRADDTANTPGAYSEVLLAEAPDRSGNYVKVKPVLTN